MTKPFETRKIIPPALEEVHLGEKILCYRPMKHGIPNLSIEEINSKVIAHNYGHGGSGWTLWPGSANHVNSLLIDSLLGQVGLLACPARFERATYALEAGKMSKNNSLNNTFKVFRSGVQ